MSRSPFQQTKVLLRSMFKKLPRTLRLMEHMPQDKTPIPFTERFCVNRPQDPRPNIAACHLDYGSKYVCTGSDLRSNESIPFLEFHGHF